MSRFLTFRVDDQAVEKLLTWHASLEHDKGARALLRRAKEPEDVFFVPAFHRLSAQLRELGYESRSDSSELALASVAGLAALVRNHRSGLSLGTQLARARSGQATPAMSAQRFQRLLEARDVDDLYRGLRRGLRLLDHTANLVSLADTAYGWPRTRRQLAFDYYGALK